MSAPDLIAGKPVATVSGRITTPVPAWNVDTDRKAANSIRRVQAWMLLEAQTEVDHVGGPDAGWYRTLLNAIDLRNISGSDIATLELILFEPRQEATR